MTATLSSVHMMAPPALRLGVWRPISLFFQVDRSPASPSEWKAAWLLKRQCALTPGQLLKAYLGLCALSLAVALGFWFMGAALVLPFACVEVVALGVAMLVFARHATDRDVIAMKADLLKVECHRAGQVVSAEFHPRWVRVEPDQHDGSLVRLSGQGRSVVVGEFVHRHHRRQLADEFRLALRHLDDQ